MVREFFAITCWFSSTRIHVVSNERVKSFCIQHTCTSSFKEAENCPNPAISSSFLQEQPLKLFTQFLLIVPLGEPLFLQRVLVSKGPKDLCFPGKLFLWNLKVTVFSLYGYIPKARKRWKLSDFPGIFTQFLPARESFVVERSLMVRLVNLARATKKNFFFWSAFRASISDRVNELARISASDSWTQRTFALFGQIGYYQLLASLHLVSVTVVLYFFFFSPYSSLPFPRSFIHLASRSTVKALRL